MEIENIEDLAKERLAELSLNMFHQIMVHHTIYFMEVAHQFGMEKALEIMKNAWPTSYRVQMKRLSKTLGFEMENNIPRPLLDMPRDDLLALIIEYCKQYIASYKKPKYIEFVDTLPRTPSNKVMKYILQERNKNIAKN